MVKNLILMCLLLVSITVSIFSNDEVDNIVRMPFSDSGTLEVYLTRIHHINDETRITIEFPYGRGTGWYTGGIDALKLNGRVFKYFYYNEIKYNYNTENIRRISTSSPNTIEFIFHRISTSQFSLYECQSNASRTCFNTNNADSGLGDDVDMDSDNDGYSDAIEQAENTDYLDANSRPLDTDKDFIPNSIDSDDDNDGVLDTFEIANGLNPLNALDAQTDLDHDGFSNAIEIQVGTNIHKANSKPIWVPLVMENIVIFVPALQHK